MKKKLLVYFLVFSFILATLAPSNVYAGTSNEGTKSTVEKADSQKKTEKQSKKSDAKTTAAKSEKKDETVKHGSTKFSDITYKRPDFDAIRTLIKSVSPLISKKNQQKKINKLCEKIDKKLEEAMTMQTFLDIQLSHDVTDQKLAKETTFVGSEISSVANLYSLLCIDLLNSSYKTILTESLSKEEIESIYKASKLLTPEYIKLQSKASELVTEYLKVLSSTTVEVNGVNMSENDLYYSTELTNEQKEMYYAQLVQIMNQKAGIIYLELTGIYKEIAKLNGFDSVTNYMYDAYDRDYTAKQAKLFSNYVKDYIVPIYFDVASTWTQDEVNMVNSASGNLTELEPYYKEYFGSVSDDMLKAYNYMKKYELFSADATPERQLLCYTTYLDSLDEPYLSLYTYGYYTDVSSFIHEFGHYNAFYQNGSSLGTNIDICEIHSQANELLFLPYYKVYGNAYSPIVKNQILTMLNTIIYGCVYNEFQQYVYSNNLTTVEELNKAYFDIVCDYGLADPSSADQMDYQWIYVSHTFQSPFYYISYAMSAVPSLEIFADSLKDRDKALKTYDKVIDYGTDYSFLKLLKKANLNSPFKEETFSTLSESLYDFLGLNTKVEKPAA